MHVKNQLSMHFCISMGCVGLGGRVGWVGLGWAAVVLDWVGQLWWCGVGWVGMGGVVWCGLGWFWRC